MRTDEAILAVVLTTLTMTGLSVLIVIRLGGADLLRKRLPLIGLIVALTFGVAVSASILQGAGFEPGLQVAIAGALVALSARRVVRLPPGHRSFASNRLAWTTLLLSALLLAGVTIGVAFGALW